MVQPHDESQSEIADILASVSSEDGVIEMDDAALAETLDRLGPPTVAAMSRLIDEARSRGLIDYRGEPRMSLKRAMELFYGLGDIPHE